MHHFLPLQRPEANALGHYRAEASWESRRPQPHEAPLARDLSSEPDHDSGRVGYCAESARGSGDGSVPAPRQGDSPALPPVGAGGGFRWGSSAMRFAALTFIRFYQIYISPTNPSICRFYPSCSAYAYEAVERWGAWRGVGLALRRLLRCHPFGGRGIDLVP